MKRHYFLAAFVGSLIAGSSVDFTSAAALETEAGVLTQIPSVYRFTIGDVRVTALTDGTAAQNFHKLLRGATAEHIDALLRDEFQTNPVQTSINVFLLEIGNRRILIDTGVGELFGVDTGGKLIGSLSAAGFQPEQIDDILITHVHADHIGGLVHKGLAVFSNATVHAGQADVDFFFDSAKTATHADAKSSTEAVEMLKPYADAGRLKPFSGTSAILPGITAIAHPGHTPGSAFYTLESQGQKIVFVGDIVHSAAQFAEPSITIVYDADSSQAEQVRKKSFAEFATQRTLIALPHLPFPGVGHIRSSGEGFQWVPLNYGNWPAR